MTNHMEKNKINFAFFGTPEFSTIILDELKKCELMPNLIITPTDKPKGRKGIITPPPAKVWALSNNIPLFQADKFNKEVTEKVKKMSPDGNWELFIVAAYGYILPKDLIFHPKFKTLNVHPSLLPKLRGASPIQNAILTEEKTGISIIRMDEEMDHGPVVYQEEFSYPNWPPDYPTLERLLAKRSGEILCEVILKWIKGDIEEIAQNEKEVTYSKIIKKEDALIDLKDKPEVNLRKIQAYKKWPKPHFFINKNGKSIRVIITEAKLKNGELEIKKVIPEGKKEVLYNDFKRNM